MNIAIVNFTEDKMESLSNAMEGLISKSQCYLFNVVCGSPDSIAHRWATENGAPVVFIENSLDAIIKEADYLIVWNDGSRVIHKLIFKFLQLGKHGTILGEKWK
jgi:hypothetical protein